MASSRRDISSLRAVANASAIDLKTVPHHRKQRRAYRSEGQRARSATEEGMA